MPPRRLLYLGPPSLLTGGTWVNRVSSRGVAETPREGDVRESVPAVSLLEGPRTAGCAVARPDILQPPADLGRRVVLPVGSGGRHLRARQGLRDAVRRGGRVVGVHVPAALAHVERVEARVVGGGEAELRQQCPSDVPWVRRGDPLGPRDLSARALVQVPLLDAVDGGTAVGADLLRGFQRRATARAGSLVAAVLQDDPHPRTGVGGGRGRGHQCCRLCRS